MQSSHRLLLGALAPFMLTACVGIASQIGSSIRAYPGAERPAHELAELVGTRDLQPAVYARLVSVNDKQYGDDFFGFPVSVKVLPGEHRVRIACQESWRVSYPAVTAIFKAGHVYEFQCRESPYGTSVAAMVDHGAMHPAPEAKTD